MFSTYSKTLLHTNPTKNPHGISKSHVSGISNPANPSNQTWDWTGNEFQIPPNPIQPYKPNETLEFMYFPLWLMDRSFLCPLCFYGRLYHVFLIKKWEETSEPSQYNPFLPWTMKINSKHNFQKSKSHVFPLQLVDELLLYSCTLFHPTPSVSVLFFTALLTHLGFLGCACT